MRSILYLILLVLRLILVIQPGYIHPDEFFQGGQELFFGIPKKNDTIQNSMTRYMKISSMNENRYKSPIIGITIDGITATWEFQVGNELRSIVPPTIMTLIPTWMYSIIFKKCNSDQLLYECLTGFEILIIPRLFMAILSMLSVDLCIWYISCVKNRSNDAKESRNVLNISGELLVLASSWVTLCFLNRPFTNSLETMCLSMLCMVVVRDFRFLNVRRDSLKPSLLNPLLMGVIGAFGLWTRFTFCIFALPAVLCFFLERWSSMKGLFEKIRLTMTTFLTVAASFLITSIYFIHEDSRFYNLFQSSSNGELSENENVVVSMSITPWNAFRYNSKVSNLNDHGLHPRYLHILVNLPMLFGPLCMIFFQNLLGRCSSKKSKSSLVERIDRMMYSILFFGIFVLSCAPHQEPRFLVPLIVPIVLVFGGKISCTDKYRRSLVAIWILFNTACFIFFGTLHQGSIQPSLLTLPQLISSKAVAPSAIVYYKTYMPPTFLYQHLQHGKDIQCQESNGICLSRSLVIESSISNMEILDAHDTPLDDLVNMLKSALSSSRALNNSLYLVAPRTIVKRLPPDDFFVDELWNSFQISTENPPDNFSLSTNYEDFKLCVYNIVMKM